MSESLSLTKEIIKHIYDKLKIGQNYKNQNNSIIQDNYLLDQKFKFEDGSDLKIWGVQFSSDNKPILKILVADCSEDNIFEYAMMISLDGAPSYGTYLSYGEDLDVYRPMIACSMGNNAWTECSLYMQASFLCGMERMRELISTAGKVNDSESPEELINFIKYYQSFTEKDLDLDRNNFPLYYDEEQEIKNER